MTDEAILDFGQPELLPGRRQLELEKRELRRGDGKRVRRGRPLMRWEYSDSDWERHLAACSRRLIDPGELSSAILGAGIDAAHRVSVATRGPLQSAVGAFIELTRSQEPRPALRQVLEGPEQPERGEEYIWAQLQTVTRPDCVEITSTGILYGEVSRLWKGRSCRFFSAEIDGEDPDYLILEFQRRRLFWWWGKTSLWVPLPREGVDRDALLATLESWVMRG